MPNIATTLKDEISRIARKEIRGEVQALRRSVTRHRAEIAVLKRRTQSLEQELRTAAAAESRQRAPEPIHESQKRERFSAKALAAQRRRLGFSAEELALLLGTSAQTIYNWEQGRVRPRATHMAAIAALKTLKKADAAAVVAQRRQ